jgi:hypothetical protein
METPVKPVSTFSIALPWGLVFGLFSGLSFILWEARIPIEEAARKGSGGIGTVLAWAAALGLVIFAHLQFKKKGDGFMSYGQGLVIAIWMGLIGGILSAIILFVYTKFINPEYLSQIKDFAMNEATKNSSSEEGEQMAEKMMGFIMSPGMMSFFKFLGVFFLHLIIGLIVSIFTKIESTAAPF